jgi:hypothetical protein
MTTSHLKIETDPTLETLCIPQTVHSAKTYVPIMKQPLSQTFIESLIVTKDISFYLKHLQWFQEILLTYNLWAILCGEDTCHIIIM